MTTPNCRNYCTPRFLSCRNPADLFLQLHRGPDSGNGGRGSRGHLLMLVKEGSD